VELEDFTASYSHFSHFIAHHVCSGTKSETVFHYLAVLYHQVLS